MIDSQASSSGLAQLLCARLTDWDQARKPQELKLLQCYQDVMRIPREDDTKGTGAARARKAAGLFMGSSRNKVRAARAKINDALFGNGKMPFDTNPTNEELKGFADTVEDIITEQLERMGFRKMLKLGTNVLCKYGTGFVFGPFVRKESLTETSVDNSAGVPVLTENKYQYDFPYFELGNTLDVYPDPEARDICKGLGTFWVTMESKHTVAAWKFDDSYTNVDEALQGGGDNGNETGSDRAHEERGNIDYWRKGDRIKVARFFGKVPKNLLPPEAPEEQAEPISYDTGNDLPNTVLADQEDDGQMVDVVAIVAGGVVVKISPSPWTDRGATHRCTYEDEEEEIWGIGVAENNIPYQKVVNAAFRLFLEGKGMALLGTKSVDRSKFLPTEDFKKYPGKVYQFKPGLSPDDRKNALIDHIEPDVTDGWQSVMAAAQQFSDDDTAITKYTQGDDSSNLNKTATGISMIMSASSMPLKEVIQNIDENWIEPIVECLIDWNLKYLDPETVKKIHGEKAAQIWQAIKTFGKTSFMEWKATGTKSFMLKEVLTNKIRAFAQFALGTPDAAKLIDVRELLEQVWDAMEIGKESPILKDADGQKVPPQIQAQMEQLQAHAKELEAALQNAAAEVEKLESKHHLEMTKTVMQAQVDQYNAVTKRLDLVVDRLSSQAVQVIADSAAAAEPDLSGGVPEALAEPEMPAPSVMPDSAPIQPEMNEPPQPPAPPTEMPPINPQPQDALQ